MTSVWVKLYIGEDDENPSTFRVRPMPDDIEDLKDKIKEKAQLEFPAFRLNVYMAWTTVRNLEGHRLIDPGAAVPDNTSSTAPLIVVAPAIASVSFLFKVE